MLVQGLAEAVERLGGVIVEHTAVTEIRPATDDGGVAGRSPSSVVTDRGVVAADVVVRATEAYTRDLRDIGATLAPLYSLMIATEPLPRDVWDEIGLRECETFCDDRRMVIYGQRTIDDRIAFGGRGARYGFGSKIDPAMEAGSDGHDRVEATLRQLLPVLGDAAITHRWGGVLGVPRDWRPSVGFDRTNGLAWAGGYVGRGRGGGQPRRSHAGRSHHRHVVGPDGLPWVDHRSRRWEPEPLRWLGINGSIRLAARADRQKRPPAAPPASAPPSTA